MMGGIMMGGLGRLGFAATALYWGRPLLGPLYLWVGICILSRVGKPPRVRGRRRCFRHGVAFRRVRIGGRAPGCS